MSREIINPEKLEGSLLQIRDLINQNPLVINHLIANEAGDESFFEINWKSPIFVDNYAGYSDSDYLERVGVADIKLPLSEFLPLTGLLWDGLGVADGKVIVLEAKSAVSELKGKCYSCDVSAPELIGSSLIETQKYLGVDESNDWMGEYYDYTAKIANLYYLRELNGIDAYLTCVYFVGEDSEVSPNRISEWKEQITKRNCELGLPKVHKLSDYIIEVFVRV
jgi:hypothetical protein